MKSEEEGVELTNVRSSISQQLNLLDSVDSRSYGRDDGRLYGNVWSAKVSEDVDEGKG